LLLAAAGAGLVLAALAHADPAAPGELGEVVVTASLRPLSDLDTAASVTVLDAATLAASGQQHIEDVLGLVPNLNWAGDTARPRYFQIRGIGELQQYQGAPNPSIGFLIDDIDFSGLGTAATLFDIDQIDVLRGPQGARYGANALGGLIYATSAAPTEELSGRVELGAADYDTQSYGAVVSGPVTALDSGFRLAVQRYTSDGYYTNAYLGRDNVAGFDELTLRGRWRYQPSTDLRVDLSVLHVQIDDGYDDFSVYNGRTTYSDQPGVDSQHSTGIALRVEAALPESLKLTTIASYADSPMKYSYDGDWGNPQFWAPYVYESSEVQERERSTRSLELRVGSDGARSTNWLVGLYAQDLRETLSDTIYNLYQDPTQDYFPPATNTVTTSWYRARSTALFGELDQELGHALTLSAGLRGEQREVAYSDVLASSGSPTLERAYNPTDRLWGGNLSLGWKLSSASSLYGLVSRGYKAGGFNLSPGLPTDELYFGPESDLNIEVGYKADLAHPAVRLDSSLFYTRRTALQVLTGTQLQADNPSSFVFYTGNATSGFNYGLESAIEYQATSRLSAGGSLGLLQTRYHGFVQSGVELPDRELPHAPPWQGAVHATWRDPRGPFVRVDVTGMGGFYFDLPPNPTVSRPYALLNARAGIDAARWSVSLWGRNLLDKNYAVRGFYFGDVPPNFPNQEFVQLGPPRTFGVSVTARL
jgi:outer membrane receptor protein involved in Fe transport